MKKEGGTYRLVKSTVGSAGWDIHTADGHHLEPNTTKLIGTGILLEMPKNVEAQVRTRSGLAINHQVTVTNSPGTIDSDYRGEVKVMLTNWGTKTYFIAKGDRIAQIVFTKLPTVELEYVEVLSVTERADGGFESTGKGTKK